jgi:hypothetical protein
LVALIADRLARRIQVRAQLEADDRCIRRGLDKRDLVEFSPALEARESRLRPAQQGGQFALGKSNDAS